MSGNENSGQRRKPGDAPDWRSLPRKRDEPKKLKAIAFRVTESEYAEIFDAAEFLGLGISGFCRRTVLRRASQVREAGQ